MRLSEHKETEMKFHSFLENPLILNLESQKLSRKAKKYAKKRANGFIPNSEGGTYNFNKKLEWNTTDPEFLIAEARELLQVNGLRALNGILLSLSHAFSLLETQAKEAILTPEQETKLRKDLLLELVLFLKELYKKEKRTIQEMKICEKTANTIEINLERLNELTHVSSEN